MSEVPYLEAWVEGVGVIGPGLTGWEQARAVLSGEAPYEAAPTALPAPELDREALSAGFVAPRTPTEAKLARIWAERSQRFGACGLE